MTALQCPAIRMDKTVDAPSMDSSDDYRPVVPLRAYAVTLLCSAVVLGIVCSSETDGDIIDVRNYPSPDGRYVLTVFQKIFYNTTLYPRDIHLSANGEKLQYPGNVYTLPEGEDVMVSWTSTTNVSLRLQSNTSVLPAPRNIAGIAITFFTE